MTLLIRTDASEVIGTGHVMRCIALAQAWMARGGRATFALATCASGLDARLQSEGLEVIYLPVKPGSTDDAVHTVDLAQQLDVRWIVVDGYHFSADYQRVIKAAGVRLLFVDDYGHAEHYYADLVLNQNSYASKELYASREPYSRLLLGTHYTLLRREFWPWRGWQRAIPAVARKILVTLGGSDSGNVTFTVLQALRRLKQPDLEIRIVAGPANPHRYVLLEEVERVPGAMHLLTQVTDMPELMAWADLAVSAAGSTCWELAFMGVPLVAIIVADNQQYIAESMAQANVALNAGWYTDLSSVALAAAVTNLLAAPDMRRRMSDRGRMLIDSLGAQRVADLLDMVEV